MYRRQEFHAIEGLESINQTADAVKPFMLRYLAGQKSIRFLRGGFP